MFLNKILFNILFLILTLGKCSTPSSIILNNSNKKKKIEGNTVKRITADGYKVEEHKIRTEDDYILTLHRIPFSNTTKPPVFLQHGLLASSSDWILSGPEKALAYILSDAGYDVWMGNSRGNRYSRSHASLNPNKREFWNFSWHEIGQLDHPTAIDYILKISRKKKLHYIGHSQGGTSFLVLASTRTDYNDRIVSAHLLAPVAFVEHIKSPLVKVLPSVIGIGNPFMELLSTEFLPINNFMRKMGQKICQDKSPIQEVCVNLIFLMCGYDVSNLNRTMIPDIIATVPAGASFKQLIHYAQVHKSKKFRQFDYGILENLNKYKSINPPEYDLSKISAPVMIYYGANDWMTGVEDIKKQEQKLKDSLRFSYRVPYDRWNHLDFLYAINAKKYLYNKILDDLELFHIN